MWLSREVLKHGDRTERRVSLLSAPSKKPLLANIQLVLDGAEDLVSA